MVYFELTIINGSTRNDFNIQVNKELYDFLTCHENAHSTSEDWFDITLNQDDVEIIQALCKTNEERQLISKNICGGTIIDILIHRAIPIKGDD